MAPASAAPTMVLLPIAMPAGPPPGGPPAVAAMSANTSTMLSPRSAAWAPFTLNLDTRAFAALLDTIPTNQSVTRGNVSVTDLAIIHAQVLEAPHLKVQPAVKQPPTEDIERAKILRQAIEILRTNDSGGYTIPARGLYPYQWNWDSALVAMGWATFDEPRAWEEMDKLFSGQWDDGMVPSIVFHAPSPSYFPGPEIWGSVEKPLHSTGITQPPIAATAVRYLCEHPSAKKAQPDSQLADLFPKLLRYHRWFYAARDPYSTGLVATLHPWETGMDNSPAWDVPLANVPEDTIPPYTRRDLGQVDAAMRPKQSDYNRYLTLLYRYRALNYDPMKLYEASPFRVTDLCTNSILHRANLDLRWLALQIGDFNAVQEIDTWIQRSTDAFASLYDEEAGLFFGQDQLTGKKLDAATSAGFLPLFARVATPEQAATLARNIEEWMDAVRFGVPSLDPRDPRFEPLRYWRGPVWAIVNYMVTDGLRSYGYENLAMRIEENTREMLLSENTLYEYYDPVTGRGAGGDYFSWTAAMCLMWLFKA